MLITESCNSCIVCMKCSSQICDIYLITLRGFLPKSPHAYGVDTSVHDVILRLVLNHIPCSMD